MKRILCIALAAIILIFSSPAYASQDNIDSIDIKATLMDDGSLLVKESWRARAGGGTEFFIPKDNLRDIEIKDFTVSDESGTYETLNTWNVNASFQEKARKCGINKTDSGIELCFGKSDINKNKTYTLIYTMTNALQSFEDMDGFNIRFVNDQMDPAPSKVSFELSLDGRELTEENARIWGFGSNAPIIFEGGKIIVKEINNFNSSNHLTVLFGLNKGIVSPTSIGKGTFENMRLKAMEGSDYHSREYHHVNGQTKPTQENTFKPEKNYTQSSTQDFNRFNSMFFGGINSFYTPLYLFITFVVIIGLFRLIKASIKSGANNVAEDVGYYRDLPMDANISLNSFIYSLNGSFSLKNVVAAYFLKWIKDGNIELVREKFEKGFIFKKDVEEDCFTIVKKPDTNDIMEEELFDIIQTASGDDLVLRNKELTKAFDKNSSIINFVEDYKKISAAEAQKLGLSTKESGFLWIKYDKLTQKGQEEAIKQKGFIKFLKDFTLINEREIIEVELWDDYLVLASLFGLGEKVLEKFKAIYPSYTYAGYTGLDPVLMYNVVNIVGSSVNKVYTNHTSGSSSSFHGGGGGMSFGGGGGFSAGGSGGGGR